MSGMGDMVDEVRSHITGIEAELGRHTDLLNQIANIPPKADVLDKLIVIGAPELRNFKAPENLTKILVTPKQSIYTKLNHWAWISEAAGTGALFVGPVGKENLTLAAALTDASLLILDGNGTANTTIGANPREVVLPPEWAIYGILSKAGEITLSTTRYQLTV